MVEAKELLAINNESLTDAERRIVFIVRSLRPYDVLEIMRQREKPNILQIVVRNTVKETFPFRDNMI